MGASLRVSSHPLLDGDAFVTRFERPLAELTAPAEWQAFLDGTELAPLGATDQVRMFVRSLLRHGGFKPSGRSKPAPEYLAAAHAEARFPRINAAVDACNLASLFSGLPISLLDVDRLAGPELAIRVCPPGTSFAFNPSGQVIDASGLLAVFDAEGPTGTPVKDAQRTKTHDATRATLSVVWGTRDLPGRTRETTAWYRALVAQIAGATVEDVAVLQ